MCALAPWARAKERVITIDLATTAADQVTTRPGGIDASYRIKLTNIIPSSIRTM